MYDSKWIPPCSILHPLPPRGSCTTTVTDSLWSLDTPPSPPTTTMSIEDELDVFAQISLNGTDHRSPIDVKGGQHPVWDAEIRLPVTKKAKDKARLLDVSCWSKEHKTDDLLGEGKIDISETLKTGEFDEWVPLMIDGVQRGDVYLPARSSTLAVPTTTAVNRRPSKLSSSDRLRRPPSNTPPKVSPSSSPSRSPGPSKFSQSTTTNYPIGTASPPRSRTSPSPSSQRRESPPPPLPLRPHQTHTAIQQIPQNLIPGGGDRRQSPSGRSVSSSPHRLDYFTAPISGETSMVYGSVPYSPGPGVPYNPSTSSRPSHHSYTLPPANQFASAPPYPYQQHVSTVGMSGSPPNVVPNVNPLYQSSAQYQLPGTWPDAPKSVGQAATISFPVLQRTSTSAYDYSFTYNAPVPTPSAPLQYPGSFESALPNPYAQALYPSPFNLPASGPPPQGRKPLDPRQELRK